MGPRLVYGEQEFPLVIDLTVQETLDLEDEFGRDARSWTSTREGIARVWATLRRNDVHFTVKDVMTQADAGAFSYVWPEVEQDPQRAEEAAPAGASGAVATTPGSES